jgi:hypothetical protein
MLSHAVNNAALKEKALCVTVPQVAISDLLHGP